MNPIQKEILEAVRELPGSTRDDIAALMPNVNRNSVLRHISNLLRAGKIESRSIPKDKPGPGVNKKGYYLSEPRIVPHSVGGLVDTVAELQAKVRELTEWRAQALERYPDLAVPVIVLEAREIVASVSDDKIAAEVRAGKKDNCPIMLATIEALNRRAA